MTIEDIQALIHGDETRTLELKKTTGELKDGIRSVCAFLNTAGGCAEILQHAIKTDYWDIDAMADAIYAIVKYPAMYKSLHELGMAEVNNIKWADAGLKVRRIYDGVINHTL